MRKRNGKYSDVDASVRSAVMARIRGQDTSPERVLRKAIWRSGLRYRVGLRTFAGRPDVVFTRSKIAIFVDGCFWHGCPEHYVKPRSKCDFWASKLRLNFERDCRQTQALTGEGWRVYRIWEHEVFESLPLVVSEIQRMVTDERYCPAGHWRVIRVDVLDSENDTENRFLRLLRNPRANRIVTRRRTTAKWRRPTP
jgi:DNA mismatch endonuclease, patch repair protein